MGRWIFGALVVAALVGCTSQAAKKMGGEPRKLYPEFNDLSAGQAAMALGYARNSADIKKAAGSAELAAAVSAFEASTPPDGWDPEAKAALVAAYKDLIETAKSGDAEQLKDKMAAMRAATSKFAADPTADQPVK